MFWVIFGPPPHFVFKFDSPPQKKRPYLFVFLSVILSASIKRFSVSRMQIFFLIKNKSHTIINLGTMVHPPPPCHVAQSVILLVKTILCLCSLGHKPYALCLPICGYKSRAARGICQSSQGSWRVNIIINFMSYFRNVLQPGLCCTSHLPLYLLLVRQHFNFIDVTLVYEEAK